MRRIQEFVTHHYHTLSLGAFIVGFAIDSIILKRIDLLLSNLILYTYLVLVVGSMVLIHIAFTRTRVSRIMRTIESILPFVAQYAFGGMFSGFLLFYSQSGTVASSWPFLLLILALIFINEFLQSYQARLAYQSILLGFCLLSFSIYSVPILTGTMGTLEFVVSNVVALIVLALFIGLLWSIDRVRVHRALRNIVIGTATLYSVISLLYVTNILPPIPLSLKDVGVYHSVERVGTAYHVEAEPEEWYARFWRTPITLVPGSRLYGFSSVFAPTDLNTRIVHEWQHRDASDTWRTYATIPFAISGGRDGGYRGYSVVVPSMPGVWRINVETERGSLIGRTTFTVTFASSTPTTVSSILE
ncbi:MAG: hypothetical protein RLZZ283_259 [Candidatus Parcubacteria bacterium]|jgi:hypothetical protein